MIIKKYGIELHRLTEDKIEMLRTWRNDPKIQEHMFYRDYITPEMQQTWFRRINNENNYYFIIVVDSVEIGLNNIKNIDYKKKCGEPGIFIYNDAYLNSDYSIRASCAITDFIFDELSLDYVYGHVLRENAKAIRFNKYFGYEQQTHEGNERDEIYVLTKSNYYKKRDLIIKYL